MSRHLLVLGALLAAPAQAQTGHAGYRVGVVSESGDIATWLKPTATGLAVDRVVPVGIMPSDIDGPHNITVSPDGKAYYITIAHGTPFGSLWKMDVAGDSLLGRAQVELFPITISVTPDGQFAFVANSDFHGDHPRTNVVSVIHTPTMTKITDVPACDMPHGVKVNHAGTQSTSPACTAMRSSTSTWRPSESPAGPRRARVTPWSPPDPCITSVRPPSSRSRPTTGGCTSPVASATPSRSGMPRVLHRSRRFPSAKVRTTWSRHPTASWSLSPTRRIRASVSSRASTLTEIARIPTSKKVVHGVAYSPDSRWAYVSSESIGTDPGAVDVIDLAARRTVASVAVPGQPTGITILPSPSTSARR